MNENDYPTEMYGRWTKVVANELKYNGYKPVEPTILENEYESEREAESSEASKKVSTGKSGQKENESDCEQTLEEIVEEGKPNDRKKAGRPPKMSERNANKQNGNSSQTKTTNKK